MNGLLRLIGLLVFLHILGSSLGNWEEWWTYEGISGPDFWGLLNPDWSMCSKGRRQSPVNINPNTLLFDPNLRAIQIDKQRVNGVITNTGHSVIFNVNTEFSSVVNISGGPLSYTYRFQEIHLHYGRTDTYGSEHTVGGDSFPAEIQIFGYNSDLYNNFTEAMYKAQGLVGIALLIQIGEMTNIELRLLTSQLQQILYKGQDAFLKSLSVKELLPDTEHYMTYEGSTTMPGCHETVSWIVMNRPLYITRQQLYALRKLMQGDVDSPKAPLGNNFRPVQPVHHRAIRTNIELNIREPGENCPSMHRKMFYKANTSNRRL